MKLDDAKNLSQGQVVYHVTKKNADGTPMKARVTSVKTWKKSPERVRVRLKRGLYDYAEYTENEICQLTTNQEDNI